MAGEKSFKVKFYQEIFDDMMAWFFDYQDGITSGHDGGVLSIIFEAIARELERLYIDTDLGMKYKIKEFLYSWFGHTKNPSQKAVGQVVFFAPFPAAERIEIPSGAIVSTEEGIQYKLLSSTFIDRGETQSSAVNIEAVEAGTSGNVKSDKITIINSYIAGVDSVSNPQNVVGGIDEESDYSYEERFINLMKGLGGSEKDALLYEIGKISGIWSSKIVEHFPPQGGINFTLIACESNGVLTSEKAEKIQAVIETNKACGVNYAVRAPESLPVDNISVVIWKNDAIEDQVLIEMTEESIETFFSSLKIGQSLNINVFLYELLHSEGIGNASITCAQAVEGIISCPQYKLITLGSNLEIRIGDN